MAPLQVLLPSCSLHIAPECEGEDKKPLSQYSTVSYICEERQWKRRKSTPGVRSYALDLMDGSETKSSKVRFDTSFECNEFSVEDDSSCANTPAAGILPFKSPSAAYFDGCDDAFALITSDDQQSSIGCNSQSTCASSSEEVTNSIDSSFFASSTDLPAVASASSKRTLRTIQYSYDTLTSRCEAPLPLSYLVHPYENRSTIFMAGKMWELSQDVRGCREVQKALDGCKSSYDFQSVVVQMRGHVWEAMRCPHANHVLRKVVQTLPASSLDFIVQEIVQEGTADVKQFVSHRYGCRVVEELLRTCRPEQLHGLMSHLLVEADGLCTHMYGNFVMKAFLQHASFVQRQTLVKILLENAVMMGTNFYACAVLAEVLQYNDDFSRALACVLVTTDGLLSAMASHKHGKAAVESVLNILQGAERQVAMNALMLPPLKVAKVSKAARRTTA